MKTSIKILHWFPRIICILVILLVSLMAADAFSPGLSIWQQLAGFFLHLIPSFVLAGILVIAWKWELLGGAIFVIIGIGLSPFIYTHNFRMNHSVGMSITILLMVTFPFIVAGILFIVSHFLKKKDALKTGLA